jgi:Mce-associated membrane protein
MAVAQPPQQVGRRPIEHVLLFGMLAVVTVLALIGTAVLAPKISAANTRDDRRAEILRAARQQAVDFTTLDYRHLDRDLALVLKGSTGDFRRQFKAGTKNLTALVTANKAVSTGEVLDAGLVSSDSDSARVLVVADSTVINTSSPKGEQRHYRIQLNLVRQNGRWLVSDLSFVG